MATDSVKNKKIPLKERVIRAALDLAAERGWEDTGLQDIAIRLRTPLPALHEIFEDRLDILAAYSRQVDRRVMEAAGKPDPSLSPRERLFDILMERFDILNEDRAGLTSILRSFKCDPKQAVIGLPHLARSMSWMLEAAGIKTAGTKGAVTVAGLTALYLRTLWTWHEDGSDDLSKTMAALDKNLETAERWAHNFGLTKDE